MKTTTKFAIGSVAVIALSAGVAGATAYAMMEKNQANTSFYDAFDTASPLRTAALDASSMQPVDLTKAAESTLNSVVHIMSIQRSKIQTIQQPDIFDFFFGDGRGRQQQVQTPEQRGFGSGVIISKDGYIVTNNHVIDGADEINVKLHDGREMKGRVIGTDPTSDLALVKIEGDDFPAIVVGNSDNLKVGEWVLAVGNPFNLGSTVTAGVVSAKSRGLGANQVESFIQTDAAINQGNSGGALVNAKGELVGINAMLYSPTGAYSGYGFAIPVSIMTKVVTDLKQYGTVQRALLGIGGRDMGNEVYPDEIRKEQKELGATEGVQVVEVTEGGSADGVLQKNDVILKLNDSKVKTMADLQGMLAKYRPGDKVKVTVLRDKKEKTFTITLKNSQGTTKVVKQADMEILGAAFRAVPKELKEQLNLGYGVEVTGVSDGRMKDSGIRKGFIILKANGKQLRSVQDLENVMKAASQSADQVLFMTGVYPSGKRANYAVDLSQAE
ncbi:MAG TPA: trypsin-like peptidase domain-containing protein [Bacteroides mediterraneensis]|uniref:trypsin-like peptidase domain-containing protein n=1 Tax=Bacteroides mediterraneensis TaxID=1841856 RepID=UPI0026074B53|nr:trypsin-like peptidase domain-containing protein [Bacteroides mediterraneensis]HJH64927.1 trypsin-like peptidase domain-containing protein [Bacteroides mediterraneensis]